MATAPDDVVTRLRAAGCVFAEDEAAILRASASSPEHLGVLVARRVSGLPLEHVVGYADFCGVRVAMEPGVFVPRHRSELLVSEAIRRLTPGDVVLDICCGSGALGLALAHAVPGVIVHAADIDPAAVRCARRNLSTVAGAVYEGDLFRPLPANLRGCAAVIIANAPYVPSAEVDALPREARLHEPRAALDGGGDGLDVHRAIASAASQWLRRDGALLIEVAAHQQPEMTRVFAAAGFGCAAATSDELEATVLIGTPAG